MTGSSPINGGNLFSTQSFMTERHPRTMKIASIILLPLVEDPAKLWRGWERVGVRVSYHHLGPPPLNLLPPGEGNFKVHPF